MSYLLVENIAVVVDKLDLLVLVLLTILGLETWVGSKHVAKGATPE